MEQPLSLKLKEKSDGGIDGKKDGKDYGKNQKRTAATTIQSKLFALDRAPATSILSLAILGLLLSSFLTLPLALNNPAFAAASTLPTGFSDRQFVSGLNVPTAMQFSPDGRLFVSEKEGNLKVIKDGALLSTPFASFSVNSQGESGLIGIAFDPNFSSNGYVYVYYTTSSSPVHNRISRITADPSNHDRMLAGSERPLLDLETLSTSSHVAGGLGFGPDGKLYISTGDNYYPYLSQSLTSRFGKILRINSDGTIPADNPFYNTGGAYKEIWALGLRNPFTFAFSPIDGKMYINDVGQDSWEEINLGSKGANYGWPTCEGACSDSRFIDPVYSYPHPTDGSGASIVGGAFYSGTLFPSQYHGSYFFGDYVKGFIKTLDSSNQATDFATGITSPVSIRQGPDGNLYYLSIANGDIHKVEYAATGVNADPVAVASAHPTMGAAPLEVTFDASNSTDPNSGDVLTFTWNFGDGSPLVSGQIVTHTYDSAGKYTAILTVQDGKGGSDSSAVDISVGILPTASIDSPTEGTHYNAGDTIAFSGSGSDSQGNALPPSAFNWTILFHHNTHTHPFQEYDGVANGAFTIPTVGETDSNVWYRIYLTVKDPSTGLTHQTTRDVLPNLATITLDSNITGLHLLLDGQPQPTPYSFAGVVGMERTLEAPSSQTVDGQSYNFQAWSDNGERIHTISTPSTNTTISAHYSLASNAPQHSLRIKSVDLAGSPITGYYTTVAVDSTVVQTGFTPLTFTGYNGTTYAVTVYDYGDATFDHWGDNSTSRTDTVTLLNADSEIVAYYRTLGSGGNDTSSSQPPSPPPAPIQTLTVTAQAITGGGGSELTVPATIKVQTNGTIVQAGSTPITTQVIAGTPYTVTVNDSKNLRFDQWDDGTTSKTRTIIVSPADGNSTLTAYYKINGKR